LDLDSDPDSRKALDLGGKEVRVNVPSKTKQKNFLKQISFLQGRIRIRSCSGSTPKCHGSGTLEDTNLLVLLPELLLLLVASFHVHLVHAQALEVRPVLVQKLKEKTRDFSNLRGRKNSCSFIKNYNALLECTLYNIQLQTYETHSEGDVKKPFAS
jgi:hypothetical protein